MTRQEKPDPWFLLLLKVGRGSQATRVQLQGGLYWYRQSLLCYLHLDTRTWDI